ncbi:MAG: hypothetical protein ACK41E_08995 [Deinococcales bacterium]
MVASDSAARATFEGRLEQQELMVVVERFSRLVTPGWIEFRPGGLALRLHRGAVVGSRGGEPLGAILLGRGMVSELELAQALGLSKENGKSLGVVLTERPFFVPESLIQDCLRQQIEGVVDRLEAEQQQYFRFFRANSPTGLYVRLEIQSLKERKQNLAATSNLPLEEVYRLAIAPEEDEVHLSADEWRVCRLLTGRRTLRQVLERSESEQSSYARAHKALESLLRRGLLETSVVSGLRTIFLRRKKEIPASYHPPAGIVSNLFFKNLDGKRDTRAIGDELRLEPDKIALIVAGLFRDGVVEVVQGESELKRLLEDY